MTYYLNDDPERSGSAKEEPRRAAPEPTPGW